MTTQTTIWRRIDFMQTTWSNHLKRLGLRWQGAAATPLLAGGAFLPKRRGASLPAAVQNVAAIVVCALAWATIWNNPNDGRKKAQDAQKLKSADRASTSFP
jgi:hypothetical protein